MDDDAIAEEGEALLTRYLVARHDYARMPGAARRELLDLVHHAWKVAEENLERWLRLHGPLQTPGYRYYARSGPEGGVGCTRFLRAAAPGNVTGWRRYVA